MGLGALSRNEREWEVTTETSECDEFIGYSDSGDDFMGTPYSNMHQIMHLVRTINGVATVPWVANLLRTVAQEYQVSPEAPRSSLIKQRQVTWLDPSPWNALTPRPQTTVPCILYVFVQMSPALPINCLSSSPSFSLLSFILLVQLTTRRMAYFTCLSSQSSTPAL